METQVLRGLLVFKGLQEILDHGEIQEFKARLETQGLEEILVL